MGINSDGSRMGAETGNAKATAGEPVVEDLGAAHDLALSVGRMASWRLELDSGDLIWRGSLERVIGFRPVGDAKGPLPDDADLGRWVLEPVLAVAVGGAPWHEYSLERPVLDADGESHVLLVRAKTIAVGRAPVACVGVVVDITDNLRTAQALQEHIDRYRLLVELSPDGIMVHQAGTIRWGNVSAMHMVGIDDLDEVVGDSLLNWVHPDSVPEMLSRIAAMKEDEDYSQPAEARIRRRDGTELYVETVSVRTKWEGEPAFQVIMRDLTERRAAQASLRYQAGLVQNVSDAIIGVDAHGTVESWNPAAQRIYGWTAAEAEGRALDELVGATAGFGTESFTGREAIHRRSDGTPVDVRLSVAPILEDRGVVGSVVVCADITESRRAEAERRAAEERYTAVVEALEEGIIVTDDSGHVTAANAAAEHILGPVAIGGDFFSAFSGDRLATHTDGRPFPVADHPAAVTLRTGQPCTNMLIGIARSGRDRRWLSVNSRPLLTEGAARPYGVVCSFSDVTERRSAESQLNYQATHDALTGLRNRPVFIESLRQALAHARR
ncbi:MAG: PAS domain S-box protein, partial [Actinobacteria bacterium]|nr:PAS domain S-box protein [Actinomycetota bacterium]